MISINNISKVLGDDPDKKIPEHLAGFIGKTIGVVNPPGTFEKKIDKYQEETGETNRYAAQIAVSQKDWPQTESHPKSGDNPKRHIWNSELGKWLYKRGQDFGEDFNVETAVTHGRSVQKHELVSRFEDLYKNKLIDKKLYDTMMQGVENDPGILGVMADIVHKYGSSKGQMNIPDFLRYIWGEGEGRSPNVLISMCMRGKDEQGRCRPDPILVDTIRTMTKQYRKGVIFSLGGTAVNSKSSTEGFGYAPPDGSEIIYTPIRQLDYAMKDLFQKYRSKKSIDHRI